MKRIGSIAITAAIVLSTGCTVTPQAVTMDEVKTRVDSDKARMYESQEPINGPLTLDEAIARTLKYNLDYQLKRMESTLAMGLTQVSSKDMLPQLVARAGYRERSNDSGGTSFGLLDGIESNKPTSGESRSRQTGSIEFSWNVLDFGVSYYRSKQQADQYLIAEERRRKVVQNLLQDVRSAYWRALGAQRLLAQADDVLDRANTALGRSREAVAQRLISPSIGLTYQRALLDATTLLNQRRQDLEFAKHELAALMNVPPNTAFTVADMAESKLPPAPADVAKLEDLALMQRPELREEDLRKRVTANEARKQMLSLLPGLNFSIGTQFDNNHFLYNNQWADGSLGVAWNLMKLASWQPTQDAQKQQEQTDEARRLALSMAVITQLRIATERYRMALHDLRLADQATDVDQRLAAYTRATVTAKLDSELEAIRTQARSVLGAYQRANAYANAQIAFGRLYSTLGFDALSGDFDNTDLKTLSSQVSAHLKKTENDAYSLQSQLFGSPVVLSVMISGLDDPVLRVRSAALVKSMLTKQGMEIGEATSKKVELRKSQVASNSGLPILVWETVLSDQQSGKQRILRYESIVPRDARDTVVEAALTNAIQLQLPTIQAWAQANVYE